MNSTLFRCSAIGASFIVAFLSPGQDRYMGANKVLESLREPPTVAAGYGERKAFIAKLAAFPAHAVNLSPEVAARQWLALADAYYDRQAALGSLPYDEQSKKSIGVQQLLYAMPGPPSWSYVIAELRSKPATSRNSCLLAFFETLAGQRTNALGDLRAALLNPDHHDAYRVDPAITETRIAVAELDRDDDAIAQAALDELAPSEPGAPGGSGGSIQIPSIHEFSNPKTAEALYRTLLEQADTHLNWLPDDSKDLARKIAIELGDRVAYPQWALADTPEAASLFESFHRRFPKLRRPLMRSGWGQDTYESDAWIYYAGLIIDGQTDKAEAFRKDAGDAFGFHSWSSLPDSLIKSPNIDRLLNHLFQLGKDNPESNAMWMYVSTAQQAGRGAEATAAARKAGLEQSTQSAFGEPDAILAHELQQGDFAAAAPRLLELAKNKDAWFFDATHLVLDLRTAGERLHDPKLTAAAANLLGEAFDKNHDLGPLVTDPSQREKLLSQKLARDVHSNNSSDSSHSDVLAALVQAYSEQKRWSDVVDILDKAPWWGATDLLAVQRNFDLKSPSLVVCVARAFLALHRREDALRVLRSGLLTNPNDPDAYPLIADEFPDIATVLFTQLATIHPDNPLPLIYLAGLETNQNRVQEAESLVRKAETLDPTWSSIMVDRYKAWQEVSKVYKSAAKWDDAERALRIYQTGKALEKAKDLDEAGLTSEAARIRAPYLSANPSDYQAMADQAADLATLGRQPEADACLRAAMGAVVARKPSSSNVSDLCFVLRDHAGFKEIAHDELLRLAKDPAKRLNVAITLSSIDEFFQTHHPASEVLAESGYSGPVEPLMAASPWYFRSSITPSQENALALDNIFDQDLRTTDFVAFWNKAAAVTAHFIAPQAMYRLAASQQEIAGGAPLNSDPDYTMAYLENEYTPTGLLIQKPTMRVFTELLSAVR